MRADATSSLPFENRDAYQNYFPGCGESALFGFFALLGTLVPLRQESNREALSDGLLDRAISGASFRRLGDPSRLSASISASKLNSGLGEIANSSRRSLSRSICSKSLDFIRFVDFDRFDGGIVDVSKAHPRLGGDIKNAACPSSGIARRCWTDGNQMTRRRRHG
jgi:hypothetical protein